ncbi:AMP-binding protein [Xenorhabdus budapestensis]|uniref:D-alanine--poly ligase subunit 1 n=1 Tax=Xenorhabdus budapestensis TaxID=290110 RepID=A0A2D0IMJ6_XENBU|nr:AMP-binding protein [Xenorhabdus budapestensis]PHM23037.1 D-alanine--poly ligase subunit 1 [Xenorhabdus budapestensis]
MNFYTLKQIVETARQGSPFYRSLYENLGTEYQLEDLPIASFDKVMTAVHDDFSALFASEQPYGMFYTTSGTTGKPKATLFGRDEWRTVNRLLAETHWRNGLLQEKDIILNLSEPGSASFMAVHHVVGMFPGRCSEIPLGCDRDFEEIISLYQHFNANVITGMNPTFLGLASRLLDTTGPDLNITRLLGGGENLYGSQMALLEEAFPNATLYPFLYGTTEVGQVAYSKVPTRYNEYIPFKELCTIEIIDPETEEVIREAGKKGTLLVTSHVRLQTPAIRLDTGDVAQWLDDPTQPEARFSLQGRRFVFEHALADTVINKDIVFGIIDQLNTKLNITMFNVEIGGTSTQPELKVLVSLHQQSVAPPELKDLVLSAMEKESPALFEAIQTGKIRQIIVNQVTLSHFELATKRKTRFITDNRY